MERVIGKFEEQVIRLCHHDFEGLTQQEAAERLGVSQAAISRIISWWKEKAPQLFPILTKQQDVIRRCIADWGWTHQGVAKFLSISKDTVDSMVATMKAKGMWFEKPRKTIRYETYHDDSIVRKF